MDRNDKLLTCKDLQHILNMGRGRVYELLKSDCFPTIHINNRMYVRETRLREWMLAYEGRKYVL